MKKCRRNAALPNDRTPVSITHPREAWGHRWPKAATPLCSANLSHYDEEQMRLMRSRFDEIFGPDRDVLEDRGWRDERTSSTRLAATSTGSPTSGST